MKKTKNRTNPAATCIDKADGAHESKANSNASSDTAAPNMMQLEDRVLYDAAPFDMEMVDPSLDASTVDSLASDSATHEPIDWSTNSNSNSGTTLDGQQAGQSALDQIDFAIDQLQLDQGNRQLVVVDASVQDYQTLLDNVAASASIELLIIDSNENGFEKIAEHLSTMPPVSAIHILSHGQAGELSLGDAALSLDSWGTHQDTISQWRDSLSQDGEVLFYGCDLAGNESGEELLRNVAKATNAEVAASVDQTGHTDLGGNWVLEFSVGEIQSEIIVQQQAQHDWYHILPVAPSAPVADAEIDVGGDSVNTSRENRGATDAVAMDANGNYVIIWSQETDTDGWQVYGQRYDYLGNADGARFTVNETSAGDQERASVAMDALGNFVVTWANDDTSEVFGRYFAASGLSSSEVMVGTGDDSSIAMNSSGQFALIWEGSGPGDSSGIYASVYAADGTLMRGNFQVNTSTSGFQRNADISINDSGELIAVWESSGTGLAQRLASDGSFVGSEITVGSGGGPTVFLDDPTIDLFDNGHFIVAGTAEYSFFNWDVEAAVFDDDDNFVARFDLSETTNSYQYNGSVSIVSDSEFLVTWNGNGDQVGQEDNRGTFFSKFEYDGSSVTRTASETRVNDHTGGTQGSASIAAFSGDRYVIVWDGEGPSSASGVFQESVGVLNQTPTSTPTGLLGIELENLTINESSFGFSDIDSDPFTEVTITTLPVNGQLFLSGGGGVVALNQSIDIAEIQAGNLLYQPTGPGYGSGFDSFGYLVNDGNRDALVESTMGIDLSPANTLWVSTRQGESDATDVPGSDSWLDGTVIEFGGPELQLGAATNGSFTNLFQIEDFFSGNLDALHHVTEAMTLGTDHTFDLLVGDILFSISSNGSIPGIAGTVENGDIIVFRPTTDDYSAGDFTLLVDRSSMSTEVSNLLGNVRAMTLVQHDTMVGDKVVQAGEILFSGSNSSRDVYSLHLDDVGAGNTSGSTSLAVDSSNFDIGRQVYGLELIERDTSVGGVSLEGGTLLISLSNTDSVGQNRVDIENNDIFVLDPDSGDASLLFDGSDVNWDGSPQRQPDAISLIHSDLPTNVGPTVDDQHFMVDENSANETSLGEILATDPNKGDVLRYQVVGGTGASVFSVDEFTGEITVADGLLLDHEVVDVFDLQVTVTDAEGLVETAVITIDVVDVDESSLNGTVLEDINANGNLFDDNLAGDGSVGFESGSVHLYRDMNDNGLLDTEDRLYRTDAIEDGVYEFNDIAMGNYFVVVDSKSLLTSLESTGSSAVWAEQTYGSENSLTVDGDGNVSFTDNDGVLFGGRVAGESDDTGSLETLQHVTRVEIGSSDETDITFGFSYNVVTNLGGGNVAATSGQTGQGTLRQFIINANEIKEGNEMRFVPAVGANDPTHDTWELLISQALPAITDDGTIINGQAYSSTNPTLQVEPTLDRVGEASATVGTDQMSLATIDLPELSIVHGLGTVQNGLVVTGDNVEILKIGVDGFGQGTTGNNILVSGADNFVLEDSVVTNSTDANIFITNTDTARLTHNLIEGGQRFGIELSAQFGGNRHILVENNFVLNNSSVFVLGDGIDVKGDSDATIQRNLFKGNFGSGIDSYENSQSLVIRNNSVIGNGIGGQEPAGIRLMGSNHEVSGNVIRNNVGDGVLVVGQGSSSTQVSVGNLISGNEFGGNGGQAIDLTEDGNGIAQTRMGDGVSDFLTDPTTAGNQGISRPTILSSNLDPTSLTTTISGTAGANQRIEIYAAIADSDSSDDSGGNGFGEGVRYIGWTTANAAGEFVFATVQLGESENVAAIAIDSNSNTSEFSANVEVNAIPTSSDINLSLQPGEKHVFEIADFDFGDLDSDPFVHVKFTRVPTGGQLLFDGVAVGKDDPISFSQIDAMRLSYVAVNNDSLVESFDFQVFDGTAYSATHQVEASVVNLSPTFDTNSSQSIDENSSSLMIEATDPESFSLLYAISGGTDAAQFTIDSATGELVFNVSPDFENPHDFDGNNTYEVEITVTDNAGNDAVRSFTISVNPVEDNLPVITSSSSFNVEENVRRVGVISATDSDLPAPGDTLTYSVDSAFNDGNLFEIHPMTGLLRFIDPPDFEAEAGSLGTNVYSVKVQVSDGTNTVAQDIVVNLLPVNEFAPVVNALDIVQVDEGDVAVTTATYSDADNPASTATYSLASGFQDSDLFTIDENTGEIAFLSPPDFEAPGSNDGDNRYRIRVVATDPDGQFGVKDVTVLVRNINEPIEDLKLDPSSIDENTPGGTVVGNVFVEDDDNVDTYTYQLLDDAGGRFTLDPNTGELTLSIGESLDYEVADSHAVKVFVEDAAGNDYTKDFLISVNDINELPVAVDLGYTVDEGAFVNILNDDFAGVTDPDGDSLSYEVVTGPSNGRLVNISGGARYIHNGSETSADEIVYRVTDGRGGSDTGVISITVNPINDNPIATGEVVLNPDGSGLKIFESSLLGNDSDAEGDELSVVIVKGPSTGKLIETPTGWLFVPDQNTGVTETIQYRVTDGVGFSNVVDLNILGAPGSTTTGETEPTDDDGTDPSDPDESNGSTGVDPGSGIDNPADDNGNNANLNSDDDNDSERFSADTLPSKIDELERGDNLLAGLSDRLNANYVFSYQKSSVDLSDLLANLAVDAGMQQSFDGSSGQFLSGSLVWAGMDRNNSELLGNIGVSTNVATVASLTGVFTVGYVLWMVRGGMLVASLASVPTFGSLDPLPILQYAADSDSEHEDESIETILQQGDNA